nr:unnamed protein product [Beta vulgaris subsp. vulgaris]
MIFGPSPRSARWPIGIAAFGLCLLFLIKNSGSARESAGNNRKEGVHVAAASAPFLVNRAAGSATTTKERIHFKITNASAMAACGMAGSDLFGYIIQVESGVTGTAGLMENNFHGSVQRALFSLRILRSLRVNSLARIQNFWGPSIPSSSPAKTPLPFGLNIFFDSYMWAPDIYEGSPTPVTAFFSIAPERSISANILRVFIYGSYGATLQQIFFFCSIALRLRSTGAMANEGKASSSIGQLDYGGLYFVLVLMWNREGIQSLLIGLFIYASMDDRCFAIVSALRQTRVKYIADLGALAKTNPISAITFSITMFSYAGIPPLAGFCSKFYLFFAALGCGAYFLAPVGVVTSVIGCWAAGRLPRVSQFGDRRQFSVHRTRSLPNQLRHGWECMLRKIGSSLIHQPSVYSISLYESTITTRDEPWFGEFELALGVIGLPVTAHDRILRCSPPVVGTTRAGPGLNSER